MAEPSGFPGVSDLKRLVADLLALVVLARIGAAQQGPAAFECRALGEAVEVDGNLAEWDRANARFVPLSCAEPLPSQKDLSASVAASFDRDALYLALHVQDERIVADTTNFWDSDGVDVYFEVGEGATPRRFRLCLLPFNEGRKFGVVTWEGRRVLGPGGLNGVEAVARELGEGSGAYGIEARIPLHPFGVDPLAAAPIRVDVAIRDHDAPDKSETDAEPPERATLSLSGRKNLAGGGAELPRLSFVGSLKRDLAARPEASTSVGRTALVGALVAIALVIFVGLSARSVQRALLPQLPRWKRIAWPALAAIALLLAAGPDAVDSVATWRARSDLVRRGATLQALLGELALPEVSARLRNADDAALRDLLQGKPLRTSEANRYEQIDALPPDQVGRGEYVSLEPRPGVPFREYGVRLGGPRGAPNFTPRFDFELPRPEPVRRLHLAIASFLPDVDLERTIVDGIEVRLEFANRTAAEMKSVASLSIDDARTEPIGHLSSVRGRADLRNGRAAGADDSGKAVEVGGRTIRHLDHYVVEIDAPEPVKAGDEPRLARFSVAPTAAAGDAIVWISAITVERRGAHPFVPLALGSTDRRGFPMAMRRWNPAPRELRLAPKGPEGPARAVLLESGEGRAFEVMELRLYYRAEGAVMRAAADPAQLKVRAWVLITYDGNPVVQRIPIRAGIEVDDALLPELHHPASMTSFLASELETRQGTLHYDGLDLPLESATDGKGPYRIRRIELEQPAEVKGALIVAGATALVRSEPPPLPHLKTLQVTGSEVSLTAEAAAAIDAGGDGRIGFAIARDGVVAQFGGALPTEIGERLRGTRIDAAARAAGDAPTATEVVRAGRRFLESSAPGVVGGANLGVVLMRELTTLAPLRTIRDAAAVVAGVLALPFILLLLVDALARVARIRFRLSILLLLNSLAPLTLLFAVLVNVVGSEQRISEKNRADDLLTQVRERVQRLSKLAADHATVVLKDLESSGVLADQGVSEENVRRRLTTLAQSFPDRDAKVAIVVEITSDGNVSRIHSSTQGGADPRFDAPNVGVAVSWGTLVFSGLSSSARLKVQVAGAVDAAALRPVRMRREDGESIALLAPATRRGAEEIEGGEALSGTLVGERLPGDEARNAAKELSAGRGQFTAEVPGGGTCGFDLLKGASGDSVAIVAAAIGARPLRVDLSFATLELPSFVLALGAVILAASLFLGTAVTDGITRPLARVLRNAMTHARRVGAPAPEAPAREDGEDEVASLETSFRRLSDELALRARQQELLFDLVAAMGRPADLRERAAKALEFVQQLVGGRDLACFVWSPATGMLEQVAQRTTTPGTEPFRRQMERAAAPRDGADLAPRCVLRAEAAEWCGDAPAALLMPLERSQRLLGMVVVRLASAADPLSTLDVAHVRGVLAQVATGIQSAQLEARAIEDVETGHYVHSHFLARLSEEIDRAAHQDRPLALIAVRLTIAASAPADLERRAVAALGRELRRGTREREIVGRTAPLEFEILLPYGGRARALEIEAELRRRWSESEGIPEAAGSRVDFGIAVLPEDARSSDFLVAVARRRVDPTSTTAASADGETIERFRVRFPEFGFGSSRMFPMLRQIEKVAPSDATLLILGDTGTGKEVVAQLVHRMSARAERALVVVHCAAIPEKLLESELFGYEKGAFTGADQRRLGRFEQADGGTLFLDEVGEIPLPVQVKLLRVLQERKVQRLGGGEEIPVDVRVLAATHQALERLVASGQFREDLYYRLKVVTLELPPLRERVDEIPALVDRFLAARRQSDPNCRVRGIEPAALDVLARHSWPGNIRELRNVIERATVLGNDDFVRREDIEFAPAPTGEARPAAPAPVTYPSLGSGMAGSESGASSAGDRAGLASPAEVSSRQKAILDWVREKGSVTSHEYSDHADVSQRTALRDLSELVRRGILVRDGTRKAAIYRVKNGEKVATEGAGASGT
jgi:DNA-binding NtrC family response regulator/GGDEF domain-containing protein